VVVVSSKRVVDVVPGTTRLVKIVDVVIVTVSVNTVASTSVVAVTGITETIVVVVL